VVQFANAVNGTIRTQALVITGVPSGIGRSLHEAALATGRDVVGAVRNDPLSN
jgi:NAD(P)-dependent dehydrogenase (short-subunit alcohol dehydrogenase family)